MYDKELIESVCDLSCNYKELLVKHGNQTKIEYDCDNPFEKYYSLNTILGTIEKYRKRKITDKELSHWACIYDWIINGGFSDKVKFAPTKKTYVIYEISDWLDSLSFFNCYRGTRRKKTKN